MKLKIDGVEFEVADNSLGSAITHALEKRDNALATAAKDVDTVKADSKKEMDGLQAKFDQLTEDHKKVKKDAEEAPKVTELVKARVALVSAATPHLDKETVEKIDDMDDRAVKVAVIKAKSEKFDEKEKSDEYINARYEGIMEHDVKDDKKETKLDKGLSDLEKSRKNGEEKTADQTRVDNMKADELAWQKPLGAFARAAGGEK